MIPKSYLYVPGDRADRLTKAPGRGAGALIADLEDSVAESSKDQAREAVATWLNELGEQTSLEIWIRVNSGRRLVEDVKATSARVISGFYLPKVESLDELEAVNELLREIEMGSHLEAGYFSVVALIESSSGVLRADRIAHGPRVARLALGEADLKAELGMSPAKDEAELNAIRTRVLLASAAAGLPPPVGPVSTDFKDLDALRASTELLKRMGFVGRAAIHPAQIDVINEVFTPTEVELESARDVVARYEEATAAGTGAIVDANGKMVDEAVVRAARRTLQLIE